MKKVFIAGSRRLSRIPAEVRQRLDEMIRRRLTILIRDANGADTAVQLRRKELRQRHGLLHGRRLPEQRRTLARSGSARSASCA